MEQNEEECIVGMGASEIELDDCCLNSSQGPAIDLSQTAKLNMSQGSVLDCVGKLCCLSMNHSASMSQAWLQRQST